MAGIVSFAAYVPKMRLGPGTRNWPAKTERAAANFDEDAITMAVAAARECLRGSDRGEVDALLLASTSLPYAEKQSASLVATAADLRKEIFTADITGSLRSGTQALKLALDGVRAGSFRNALVIATDHRQGPPGSDIERDGGDAAVALLVGAAAPAVEVTATYSVVNDILDVWRGSGERLLRSTPEEHFRYEEGYLHAIKAGLEGLGAVAKRGGGDFQRVALYSPDSRRRAEAVRRLGLDAARVIESPAGAGSSGVAHALLQLVSALDVAGADEEILVLNYGDGCDALALRTTAALATSRHGRTPLASQLARAVPIADYYDFLRWRGLGPVSLDGARTAPAPHAVYREQDEVIRLHGMRCNACEMVQYPAQRVCVRCKAKDNNTTVAMADGGATLFSYSLDYVAATPDVPLLHGVVDFDIGGRAMMMVTDRDLESVAIGMKLDLTFRKFLEADGVSAYLWKAAPAR